MAEEKVRGFVRDARWGRGKENKAREQHDGDLHQRSCCEKWRGERTSGEGRQKERATSLLTRLGHAGPVIPFLYF